MKVTPQQSPISGERFILQQIDFFYPSSTDKTNTQNSCQK